MSTVTPATTSLFPECPGYGFTAEPQYLVKITPRDGGFERVDKRWTRPLIVFTAVPFGARDESEIQSILNFWHVMGGRSTPFRFKDWTDYKSCPVQNTVLETDQPFEPVTVGSSLAYQLVKLYQVGSLIQVREITAPKGDTLVVANEFDAVQTDWTIDESTGLLTTGGGFVGTPQSWGGEFYVPVRFDSEMIVTAADKAIQGADFTLRERRVKLTGVPVTSGSPGEGSPGAGSGGGGASPGSGSGGGGFPSDGRVWTGDTAPPVGFASIVYLGSGIIVAAGQFGDVYRSVNSGTSWTKVLTDSTVTCVEEGNSLLVGTTSGTVRISTDNGATWGSAVTVGAIGSITGLATDFSNNWVATGDNFGSTSYAVSSDDGGTWSVPNTISSFAFWLGLSAFYDFDVGQFVGIGLSTSFTYNIYTSPDGSTWTHHAFGAEVISVCARIGYNGVSQYMLGYGSSGHGNVRVANSVLGLLADTGVDCGLGSATSDTHTPSCVYYIDDVYFAFGDNGGVSDSTDGVSWHIGVLNMGTDAPRPHSVIFTYDQVRRYVAVYNQHSHYIEP